MLELLKRWNKMTFPGTVELYFEMTNWLKIPYLNFGSFQKKIKHMFYKRGNNMSFPSKVLENILVGVH
jgi:hypothetical protein